MNKSTGRTAVIACGVNEESIRKYACDISHFLCYKDNILLHAVSDLCNVATYGDIRRIYVLVPKEYQDSLGNVVAALHLAQKIRTEEDDAILVYPTVSI